MHYFIDGYNLLFKVMHTGQTLQEQRQEIIQNLAQKITLLDLNATVVFDSHYQPDEGTRSHIKNLEVIFSGIGQSADEFILQALKECAQPQKEMVVTSDKKLSWLCRKRLANTQSIEEFINWLNKRYHNKLKLRESASSKSSLAKTVLVKSAPKPPTTPKKKTSAEECFNYYLEAFQKEVDELAQKESLATEQKKQLKGRTRKKSIKEKPKGQDPLISDMQRWLDAFEGR